MFKPNRYKYEITKDFVDELIIFGTSNLYEYKSGDIISLRKDSKIQKKWSDANLIKIIDSIEPTY